MILNSIFLRWEWEDVRGSRRTGDVTSLKVITDSCATEFSSRKKQVGQNSSQGDLFWPNLFLLIFHLTSGKRNIFFIILFFFVSFFFSCTCWSSFHSINGSFPMAPDMPNESAMPRLFFSPVLKSHCIVGSLYPIIQRLYPIVV